MRRRVARFGRLALPCFAALAVSGMACPSPARANDCTSGPTALASPCVNSDILWPHAGPARFVAVGGTETVAAERVGFGLVTSYLSRPVVLHVATPGPGGSDQNAVDNQVSGTFLWAYGVTDRLELDLAVPITFIQDGAGLSPITGGPGLKDTAVRDLRFGFTYALAAHARVAPDARPEAWGLAARFEVSAPTGEGDQLAGERSAVFVPSVAADWRSGRLTAGLEVGARVRPTTDLEGGRIGTQIVTAVGVGVDLLPRDLLTAALEAWALPTLAQQDSVRSVDQATIASPDGAYIAPAEWQLSARSAPLPGGDLSLQLGGGGELPITEGAFTMPRFRFTLGVRWAPTGRPVSGRSGAPGDTVDLHLAADPGTSDQGGSGASGGSRGKCASEPELVDGFRQDTACPDEDQDADGIPDRLDRCPMVPEDLVGLADGCPEKR